MSPPGNIVNPRGHKCSVHALDCSHSEAIRARHGQVENILQSTHQSINKGCKLHWLKDLNSVSDQTLDELQAT